MTDVEETFTYGNYVQDPLKYTDPSGYLCDNPPYWQQVQSYLMCMNAENAEALNNVGIDNVQVATSPGHSGGYVSYQVGGVWHTVHYNGYVDYGYHESWNSTPSLDAYASHESSGSGGGAVYHGSGGCGGGGGGGSSSTSGGWSKPVVHVYGRDNTASNASKCNDGAQLGSVMGVMGPAVEHIFKKEAKLLEKTKSKADKYYYKVFNKASKVGKSVGFVGIVTTEVVYTIEAIEGDMSTKEFWIRSGINAAEFAISWAATKLVALGVIGAAASGPVLIAAGVVTAGIIVCDIFGVFDGIIYDESTLKP